jgi:hypothetical protein
MLQKAGILPVEGDVFRDPLFMSAGKAEYRERIRQAIDNWRNYSNHFSGGYDSIVYSPDDPVAAYRNLDPREREEIWRQTYAGRPLSMPTLEYVQCQERHCYELLLRGVGERQIAAETNLDVLEVREIAGRHNMTTHL